MLILTPKRSWMMYSGKRPASCSMLVVATSSPGRQSKPKVTMFMPSEVW